LEAKTPQEFFDVVLPQRFDPAKAVGVDVVVQLTINGPNGGDWVVTVKDQKIKVTKGLHPSPTLSVKMAEKDYLDLVNEKLSSGKAFMTGKLQFKGNIVLALKLRDMGFI
jgi:putative sterol carrier protein